MIIDTLDNLILYSSLNPYLEVVYKYIKGNELDDLSEGWHGIAGDGGEDAYAMVATEMCRNDDDADMEAHRKYLDIQICLRGRDRIGWRPLASCRQQLTDYEVEDDLVFYGDEPAELVNLCQGLFVLFLPEDVHKPLVGQGEVRKLVFKLRCD
jgi:YhcH/YjgK/YiaL family protein